MVARAAGAAGAAGAAARGRIDDRLRGGAARGRSGGGLPWVPWAGLPLTPAAMHTAAHAAHAAGRQAKQTSRAPGRRFGCLSGVLHSARPQHSPARCARPQIPSCTALRRRQGSWKGSGGGWGRALASRATQQGSSSRAFSGACRPPPTALWHLWHRDRPSNGPARVRPALREEAADKPDRIYPLSAEQKQPHLLYTPQADKRNDRDGGGDGM